MDVKLENSLDDQQDRLFDFLEAISNAASALPNSSNDNMDAAGLSTNEHVSNTLQQFLHSNSRLQKLVNSFIEHQSICRDIELLESKLDIVNGTIKSYVKCIDKFDHLLHKSIDSVSIHTYNIETTESKTKENDKNDNNEMKNDSSIKDKIDLKKKQTSNVIATNPFTHTIVKHPKTGHITLQNFTAQQLLQLGYKLRVNSATQSFRNVTENVSFAQNEVPSNPPCVQHDLISQSILNQTPQELKDIFLETFQDKIKTDYEILQENARNMLLNKQSGLDSDLLMFSNDTNDNVVDTTNDTEAVTTQGGATGNDVNQNANENEDDDDGDDDDDDFGLAGLM